jgi:hypothetical protein
MSAASGNQQGEDRWTVQDVRDRMITNEQLKKDVEKRNQQAYLDGLHRTMGDTPEFANVQRHYDELMQTIAREEKERGTGKIDMLIGTEIATTSANQTREGRNYLLINEKEFKAALLTDAGMEPLKATLGHEITHVVHGDNTPANEVREHNDRAYSRMVEMRADLEGSGPQGMHNPQGAIDFFEGKLRAMFPKLRNLPGSGLTNADPSHLTDADYKKLSDLNAGFQTPDHPSAWDRITALREEATLMAQYESTHTVRTQADREAEAREVVGRVMRDMRGIIQLDPTTESPIHPSGGGHGGKSATHTQLEDIRNTIGSHNLQAANDIGTPHSGPSTLPSTGRMKS